MGFWSINETVMPFHQTENYSIVGVQFQSSKNVTTEYSVGEGFLS